MKKIYLHIGLEKTGTTAIQSFLSTNRRTLAQSHKILFPKFEEDKIAKDSNHRIAKLFVPNKNISPRHSAITLSVLNELLENFNQNSKWEMLIISSELFSYSTKTEIQALKKILNNFDVTVILFLRRQDEYLESLYDQHIKRVWSTGRVPTPTEKFYTKKKLDFHKFILNWYQNGFKNIDVKIYGLSIEKNFIFNQFFENINSSIFENEAINIDDKVANPSLSLFHKILITKYVPRINDETLRKKTAELIFRHNMVFSKANNNQILTSKNYYTNEFKMDLLQNYEASNRQILALFPNAGFNKDVLFQPVGKSIEPLTIKHLSKDNIMLYFFNLLLYFVKNYNKEK